MPNLALVRRSAQHARRLALLGVSMPPAMGSVVRLGPRRRRHGQWPAGKRGPHDHAVVVVGPLAPPLTGPSPSLRAGTRARPGRPAKQEFSRPDENPPAVLCPRDLSGPCPAVSGRIQASCTNTITIADCRIVTAATWRSMICLAVKAFGMGGGGVGSLPRSRAGAPPSGAGGPCPRPPDQIDSLPRVVLFRRHFTNPA